MTTLDRLLGLQDRIVRYRISWAQLAWFGHRKSYLYYMVVV